MVLLGEVVSPGGDMQPMPTDLLLTRLFVRSLVVYQDLDVEDEVPLRPAANAEEAKEIMASIEEKKVR